jgi:hypothetical protein
MALSLLPIVGVVDALGLNVELSRQFFYQHLCPLYLEVGGTSGFAISNNANADSLAGSIPRSARHNRPLSLPLFGWLYLAIFPAEAVANNKVAVDILGTGQAAQRSQLFYVTGLGATIVNFNATPAAGELSGSRENSFFDRIETVIARKRKCTSGRRIITQSH